MARCWFLGFAFFVAAMSFGCSPQQLLSNEVEGTWRVSQIIDNGESVSPEELHGMTWTFAGGRRIMKAPDEGPDEMTYTLDPTREPKAIDLKYPHATYFADETGGSREVERLLAIYKHDGDTLKIASRPPTAPQQRPTGFEFEKGTSLSVMILTRSQSEAAVIP